MSTDRSVITTSAVNPAVAEAMEMYQRMEVVRSVLAPDLSDSELQLFAIVAQRSGLDPFARQIYAVKRSGRVTFQTGIDGYRSTAERTSEYAGSDEPEFGPDQGGHPEWARVTVYRIKAGVRFGQSATAHWAEFHPGGNAPMWTKMPRNQLAKCAEALALRKAFPYVLADVYVSEEMDQAGTGDNAGLVEAATQPTARERLHARREVIEGSATASPAQDAPGAPSWADAPTDATPTADVAATPSAGRGAKPAADAPSLVARLQASVADSALVGPITDPQKDKLRSIIGRPSGLDWASEVLPVLVDAFGEGFLPDEMLASQANAIISIAGRDGQDAFVAAWRSCVPVSA